MIFQLKNGMDFYPEGEITNEKMGRTEKDRKRLEDDFSVTERAEWAIRGKGGRESHVIEDLRGSGFNDLSPQLKSWVWIQNADGDHRHL